MLIPTSHAIVVAPFIAIGTVQLIVWLVGVISIPVMIIVKIIGKTKLTKAVFITFLVAVFVGILAFAALSILKTTSGGPSQSKVLLTLPPDNKPSDRNIYAPTDGVGEMYPFYDPNGVPAPTDTINLIKPESVYTVPSFALILTLFSLFSAVAFIPAFITLVSINHEKKLWTKLQTVLLGISISLVISALVLFGLFATYYKSYVY